MNPCGTLLGVTTGQLVETMRAILESEKHYERLLMFINDPVQIDVITQMIADERQVFGEFAKLYTQITCDPTVIPPLTPPTFTSYLGGIELAIMKEIQDYNNLLKLSNATSVQAIHKVFTLLFTIIVDHLKYLDFLFIKNSCESNADIRSR